MVHVGACPCELGRGKPSTEFYDKNGKPQIYCYGWGHDKDDIDTAFDCCKECKDWAYGEQPTIDLFLDRLEKDLEEQNKMLTDITDKIKEIKNG